MWFSSCAQGQQPDKQCDSGPHNRCSYYGNDEEWLKVAKMEEGGDLKGYDRGNGGADRSGNIGCHEPMPNQRRSNSDSKEDN